MRQTLDIYGTCSHTLKCRNNRCIFRLAHCFGFPYPCGGYEGAEQDAERALKNAGIIGSEVMHCPKMSASVGTNVIYVHCESFIGDK